MSGTPRLDLTGDAAIKRGDPYEHTIYVTLDGGRVVDDGRALLGESTVSSPSAKFESGDVSCGIFGAGIPLATTITAVSDDGLQATLSAAITEDNPAGLVMAIRTKDCSAWTFEAQMKANARSDDVKATFVIDDTNSSEGELVLTLDATTTRGLPSSGVWDLQALLGGEPDGTWAEGAVKVKQDVTR